MRTLLLTLALVAPVALLQAQPLPPELTKPVNDFANVIDAGLFWDAGDWHIKLDVLNALDERYYRARTGDALGDALAQAMPLRHWALTLRHTF